MYKRMAFTLSQSIRCNYHLNNDFKAYDSIDFFKGFTIIRESTESFSKATCSSLESDCILTMVYIYILLIHDSTTIHAISMIRLE